jgi:RecA/RadA recombinase
MAAALHIHRIDSMQVPGEEDCESAAKILELPEFAGVFRGRELTRKDRRLSSGLFPIDELIGGGIVRGRVSEITGGASSGKTSLAVAFVATATRRGEVAAWIAAADDFDPESFAAANIDLARVLWVSCGNTSLRASEIRQTVSDGGAGASLRVGEVRQKIVRSAGMGELKAAEWLLAAGGLGLVVIDFGAGMRGLPQSAALRLARAAERSGTAVIVLAGSRMCGTFAALSLALRRDRACFSRPRANAPILFDGMVIEARVARNKLGGSGSIATWKAAIEPSAAFAETPRREGGWQRMMGNSAAY